MRNGFGPLRDQGLGVRIMPPAAHHDLGRLTASWSCAASAPYADIADKKEFDELPGLVLTDPLTLDFSSVAGIPPMETPLGDYLEILRTSFAPFTATHHAITGHVVDIDGDRATIHAHVRAEHWLPDELTNGGPNRWLVVGFYDNEAVRTADGWRFNRVKLTATHQENAHLASAALPPEQAR